MSNPSGGLLVLPLLVTLLLSTPSQAAGQRPALATVLPVYGVPLPPGATAERTITSFGVFDDARWFVIAYYEQQPDGFLHTLVVRSFDKRARTWRSVERESIGSVLSIHRSGGLLYVGGHTSPSAAPLLVFDDRLALKRTLDGWPLAFLPDGRVVFSRSMIHFAPMHAQAVALYDPRTDRDLTIYPARVRNLRGGEQVPGADLWMDRWIGEVKVGTSGRTIEFPAGERPRRFNTSGTAEPIEPEVRIRVTCSMTGPRPVCRRSQQANER